MAVNWMKYNFLKRYIKTNVKLRDLAKHIYEEHGRNSTFGYLADTIQEELDKFQN